MDEPGKSGSLSSLQSFRMTFFRPSICAITVVFASALLASAGGAGVPSSQPLSADGAGSLQGRTCPAATTPARLPDLAALLDVTAFLQGFASDSIAQASVEPMIFSIRFAPTGQREWVQAVGAGSGAARLAHVQRLIATYLKQQTAAKEPWSLRLRIMPGDSVHLSLAHSEVCPVELIPERSTASGGSLGLLDREELAELRRAGPVEVEVDVSPTGSVLGVDLRRRSGSRIVDDQMLKRARESRYRPALIDGFPVAGRYVFGSRTRVRVRSATN